MEQDSLVRVKARVYDILANRHKLQDIARIGALSPGESAVCAALTQAIEVFQEEAALELAAAVFDGLAPTFLTIYEQGLPDGANMQNPNIQRVAELLAKAGADERAKEIR